MSSQSQASAIGTPRTDQMPGAPQRATRSLRRWLGAGNTQPFRGWERAALLAITALAAVLNLLGLNKEGYANTYYAATVKSMLTNWHNFFFVSFDPGGFISVDKPPLGFWVQAAFAKILGFSGWSILLPEALAGIAAVLILYALVRRTWGPVAGLSAALILAVTPISVVTNRNNTIDSLLVVAMLGGVWASARAVESNRHPLRWLLLAAVFVGLGFNIKMLQAYLVLPALWATYLLVARPRLTTRIAHLALATVVMLAISLSWATVVDLTPAALRPFVGSSTNNTVYELILGHNGLQRLFGRGGAASESLSSLLSTSTQGAGGVGGTNENGAKGVLRLLNTQLGGQSGWFIPLAIIGGLVAAWQVRLYRLRFWQAGTNPSGAGILRRRQTSLLLWTGWFGTMAVFFSVAGFYHRYYLTVLAPAIAALVGIGLSVLWQAWRRQGWRNWLGWTLPLALLGTAVVQVKLLTVYPTWSTRLSPLLLGLTITAAVTLFVARLLRRNPLQRLWGQRVARIALTTGLAALLLTPTVWSAISVQAANSGGMQNLPVAGPNASGDGFGGPGGMGQAPAGGRQQAGMLTPPNAGADRPNTVPAIGNAGAVPNRDGGQGGPGGGIDSQLQQWLLAQQGTTKYLVAVQSANEASGVILNTGKAVMAYGGFEGSDPTLTADSLATLVSSGQLRYIIVGNRGGFGGAGSSGSFSVASWVQQHGTLVLASTWGGTSSVQIYDLAAGK